MYYLTHIKADGTVERTHQEQAPTLGQLRKAVGGHIESVPYWDTDNGKRSWVICNEEGKLEGLPTNWVATTKWWDKVPMMKDVDYLVGDILVIACDTDAEFRRL